jgi:energy-converting hydrogenase Eha subunit A
MKKRSLFLSAVAAFGFTSATIAQQWSTKAPMPTSRVGIGAAVVNNIIYVIGGGTGINNVVGTVEAYDPATNTWTTKAPMPTPRVDLGIATVNGKIYAIGGFNTNALNTVEEYNPVTDTWTTKANMPTTRSQLSVTVLNGRIYAIGGWPNNITNVEEYNPTTDTWVVKPPIAQGRVNTNGSTTCNGEVYFMGGKNNLGVQNTNEAFNNTTNTWTPKSNLPDVRWSGSAITLNNKIHYLGGTNSTTYTPNASTHYIYDPSTDTWTSGLSMLGNRSSHAAVALGNEIYVIGGYNSLGNFSNLNEVYNSCPNNLGLSPSTNNVNTGGTANFTATPTNLNYTWQSDFGQGFQTLINYGNYSGVTTNILTISNLQVSNHNQPLRVIFNTGSCIDTSIIAYINISDTCINTVLDTTYISVTDTLIINTTLGLNPPNNSNTISVFPNPTNDHITIDYGNYTLMNGYQLLIENSVGQQMFQTTITQQSDYLSLASWTGNGLYFVQIIDPNGNTIDIRKIILQ